MTRQTSRPDMNPGESPTKSDSREESLLLRAPRCWDGLGLDAKTAAEAAVGPRIQAITREMRGLPARSREFLRQFVSAIAAIANVECA